MKIAILILLTSIFFAIGMIHLYWFGGGRRGIDIAIPTREDGSSLFEPGRFGTLIVSIGFFALVFLSLNYGNVLHMNLLIEKNVLQIFSGIFLLRFIGEFNYIGFFSKDRKTKFHYWDVRFHTPLCLLLSILLIIFTSI